VVVPRGDAIALARALIKIDSRNPTLVPDAPGERACAHTLATILEEWGFVVHLQQDVPGRPNVIASIGPRDTPTLMLNGHLDVVGIEGMTHDPFTAEVRDKRIYGRGSSDMKAGIAAMCAAASRAAGKSSRRQIMVTAVADEEYESLGMRALIDSGIRADAAIITEPTRLAICPAHRGFVWMDVIFRGRAAHGSRYDIGIDAITHAGLVLAELEKLERTRDERIRHQLLGRGSLHASVIRGGVGMSTYPEECVLSIERRTLPGETADDAVREIENACAAVRARDPRLDARITQTTSQLPSDVSTDSPIVKRLTRALETEKLPVRIEGMSAWTDAALLNAAGIPTVCFGPGDIGLAHAAEEFVAIAEIETATRVLGRVVQDWSNAQ
jgi:acetylornithine deacetylase